MKPIKPVVLTCLPTLCLVAGTTSAPVLAQSSAPQTPRTGTPRTSPGASKSRPNSPKAVAPKATAPRATAPRATAPRPPVAQPLVDQSPAPSDAELAAARVEKSDALLQAEEYDGALTAAEHAARLQPQWFKGHYYVAYALYKQGKLDAALPHATQARKLAPQQSQADVVKLVDAITKKQKTIEQIRIGDEAMEAGLIAKAARVYMDVWKANPENEEVGMKAALLWVDRLDKPEEALDVLNYLSKRPSDSPFAEGVQALLLKVQPTLERIYGEKLQAGIQALENGELDEALQSLTAAVRMQPQQQEGHLLLTRVYAKKSDIPAAIKSFTGVVKGGQVKVSEAFQYPELAPLLENAQFAAFLADALGEDALKKARDAAVQSAVATPVEAPSVETPPVVHDPRVFGMNLRGVTANPTGKKTDAAGVLVVDVAPGTPAANAGIQANDVIEKVGQTGVSSPEDVELLIDDIARRQNAPEDKKVALLIRRNNVRVYIVMSAQKLEAAPFEEFFKRFREFGFDGNTK